MNNLLLDISSLYRDVQKYLDKNLKNYSLGSGQFLFILTINENEGITMQELAEIGNFDKGTTSKTISKCEDEGYILVKADEFDRRIKRLYTTNKAATIINDLYEIRKKCTDNLLLGLDKEKLSDYFHKVALNSKVFIEEDDEHIKIGGIQKISLVDYPNKMACTVFTSGCNFKCPFCHNKDLVFVPPNITYYQQDEIFNYLSKRKEILNAVCISGGEPCVQASLIDFIFKIKELGYLVKLDTNGYYPDYLQELIETNNIDYIAMDIKNSKEKYAETVGLKEECFDITNIDKSIQLIKNCGIDYEFRTTLVSELHTLDDVVKIKDWIKECKCYTLQPYKESENVISQSFSTPSDDFMQQAKQILSKNIKNTKIRGEN